MFLICPVPEPRAHCRHSLMVIKAFDDEVIMLPLLLSSDF